MTRNIINKAYLFILLLIPIASMAAEPDTSVVLQEVMVRATGPGLKHLRGTATNSQVITSSELARAACCNLGESFTTNPSVDVSYNDAATGARQIKLLGLSGTYVQMLTENIPNFRGAALPYGLGYVAGSWLQSIQVSKGASSVKNGCESITGQINVEMKKPQADESVAVNAYTDITGKVELNANGNMRLSPRLSTGLLVHGENTFTAHDHNGDGFMDMPLMKQVAAMNRWAWMGNNYVFQAGVKFLAEKRRSGQMDHGTHTISPTENERYNIVIRNARWEAFTKNAYIFDKENDGNVALIVSGAHDNFRSNYGHKIYDVGETNIYSSLMFERKFGEHHQLSTGVSFNFDGLHQHFRQLQDADSPVERINDHESLSGVYGQYTLNLSNSLLVMAGMRYDYSNIYGSRITPRFHMRWNHSEALTLHGSVGRGYRSPRVLAENNFLLASSRRMIFDANPSQEVAWNYGAGVSSTIHINNRKLTMSAEYYFTDFEHALLVDLDTSADAVYFRNLNGRSFSHTVQLEATCELFKDFSLTAAYRLTDVQVNYGSGMVQKPLTSRNKGLFTASYSPMMGLWQFDVTCSIQGGGRMPAPASNASGAARWNSRYNAFAQLNAQVTRNFRRWAIYVGGENLTAYRQKSPVIGAHNPWGPGFDATMVYAPLHGAIIYAGFRYNFTKY